MNLQYEDGKLIVFVVKNKLPNEIHGILDTLGTAQSHIKKLSNLGFTTDEWKIDAYRMTDK